MVRSKEMKYSDSEIKRETKSAGEVHTFSNAVVLNPASRRVQESEEGTVSMSFK